MPSLRGSAEPLTALFDAALLDLDGVVYLGPDAIHGVPEALAAVRAQGMRLAFVTNNAARPPEAVAKHLNELGVAATAEEIVTSAQAAARHLADRLPAGARVLVVGTVGLEVALRERGLTPVSDALGPVDAVVQGYSPDMNWKLLAEGAVAINRGVPWVATNLDPTVPSTRGPLPGNGSLVAALRHATRREPIVTGKPDPAMHRESVLRSGASNPIVVGDRLDTDIEGANAVGCASLLVMSGVTGVAELLDAPPEMQPNYLAADAGGLLCRHPETVVDGHTARCGAWTARAEPQSSDRLRLTLTRATTDEQDAGRSETAPEPGRAEGADNAVGAGYSTDDLDAIRAMCAARWAGPAAQSGSTSVEPASGSGRSDAAARALLDRLELST